VRGAKGSPGCTWLVAGLGKVYASGRLEVLLVDADAEAEGLLSVFGAPAGDGGRSLARAAKLGPPHPDVVRQAARAVSERLWVLETMRAADSLRGADLVAAARARHAVVIIDLGHRLEGLQRELESAADWTLWVAATDRSGLERADRALTFSPGLAASTGLVINRGAGPTLEGSAALLRDRYGLPVVARLERGGAIRNRWRLRRMASALHPDLARIGLPWS